MGSHCTLQLTLPGRPSSGDRMFRPRITFTFRHPIDRCSSYSTLSCTVCDAKSQFLFAGTQTPRHQPYPSVLFDLFRDMPLTRPAKEPLRCKIRHVQDQEKKRKASEVRWVKPQREPYESIHVQPSQSGVLPADRIHVGICAEPDIFYKRRYAVFCVSSRNTNRLSSGSTYRARCDWKTPMSRSAPGRAGQTYGFAPNKASMSSSKPTLASMQPTISPIAAKVNEREA